MVQVAAGPRARTFSPGGSHYLPGNAAVVMLFASLNKLSLYKGFPAAQAEADDFPFRWS